MVERAAHMAARRLRCTLVTPDRPVFNGEAEFVVVPGPDDGEVGFCPGHAAYTAILGYGVMKITESPGHVIRFAIFGGFVQVLHDQVTVLAHRAQKTDEITEEHLEIDRRELDGIRVIDEASYIKKVNKMREAQVRLRAVKPEGTPTSHA